MVMLSKILPADVPKVCLSSLVHNTTGVSTADTTIEPISIPTYTGMFYSYIALVTLLYHGLVLSQLCP